MFDPNEIRSSAFASLPDAARLAALNRQLAYAAARSPYYRESLGDAAPLPSLSALSRLPFLTADTLRAQGRRLVCSTLGEGAGTLGKDRILPDDCVVIGNEGHGISEEILSEASAFLTIPMTDTCESLNASAAAAVILWEYAKLRGCRQNKPDGEEL